MSQFTIAGFDVDTSKFPQTSMDWAMRRMLSHVLLNETAAKVTAANKKAVESTGSDLSDADKEALKREYIQSTLDRLYDGTIATVSRSGPRLDPVEAEVAKIVKQEVIKALRGRGIVKGRTNPTEDTAWTFGKGETAETVTFREFMDRYLAKHEAATRKQAKANVDKAAREAQKLAEAAANAQPIESSDDLGF